MLKNIPSNRKNSYRIVKSFLGVNAAVRAVVRNCINKNVTPAIIKDGIGGLLAPGGVHEYKWWDVRNFTQHGGTNIGTSRKLPSDFGVERLIRAIKVSFFLFPKIIVAPLSKPTRTRTRQPDFSWG